MFNAQETAERQKSWGFRCFVNSLPVSPADHLCTSPHFLFTSYLTLLPSNRWQHTTAVVQKGVEPVSFQMGQNSSRSWSRPPGAGASSVTSVTARVMTEVTVTQGARGHLDTPKLWLDTPVRPTYEHFPLPVTPETVSDVQQINGTG